MAKYFTLAMRDGPGQPWFADFGDFDRETVVQERIDRHESHPFPQMSDMRIVGTGKSQDDINHAIFRLNHPTAKV